MTKSLKKLLQAFQLLYDNFFSYHLGYGVGVSIRGSHPRDPGSIPGIRIFFIFHNLIYYLHEIGVISSMLIIRNTFLI